MVGQIFHRVVLPAIPAGTGTGRRRAVPISRAHHFVKSFFVPLLNLLFDASVLYHEEAPRLIVSPVGRANSGLQDLPDEVVWDRVRLQSPHGARRADNME
jgi:hypothetical protein